LLFIKKKKKILNYFLKYADVLVKILSLPCMIFIIYGVISSLFFVKMDIQQKDAFRIIYVHVPSAYMSIFIYVIMGVMSILYLTFKDEIFNIIAYSSVEIGAVFTFIALCTGSIWGKPMWGTWWIWDARLTSELILLFLYLGYLGLRKAIMNDFIASKSCAILNLLGLINIPIIHYSVEWWYTLHQKATLSSRPTIEIEMLYPLLAMILGFFLFYVLIVIISVKNEILIKKNIIDC